MVEVLSIELQAKIANFVNGMKTAASVTKNTEDKITKSTKSISNAVTSNLTGIFSIAAVAGFAKAVFQVTAEFQKFNAVLGNTLGSASLASIKLREIQDFASKTPFGIQELTSAFVKLANSGFKPTGDQMRSLGDLASSTGKSFDQLAEAILDAQTGEFERLKEFGIRAKDAGDSVIFTYKGVQTQVEKTSDAIRDYITNLGNAEGVSGSMAKISETLGGQISNLGDNWDKMLLSVGSNTTGVFNSSISVISKAIDKITQYNEELSIAEKNNLGSDFFQQLNRAVNPFAGKGATDKELGVGLIKEATKEVGAFISKATQGAKSSKDFGKAMADLSEKSKLALTSPAIRSENVRKGIYDAFREGVIAIDDARKAFENSGDLKSGNFGTAKAQKGVKSLSDVLKELEQELDVTNTLFKSTFDERNEAQITAYTKAIETTTKAFGSQSKIVQDLISKRNALFQLPSIKTGSALLGITPDKNTAKVTGRVDTSFGANMSGVADALIKEQVRIIQLQENFNRDFDDVLNRGMANSLASLGDALGNVLANGGNAIEAIGSGLLSTIGGVLTQLGELAIGVGVGIKAIKTALQTLNPFVAIAAGVALVTLGGFVSNRAKQIGGGGGQGSTSNFNDNPIPLASGGLAFAPTNALIGEYSGARNNPEVVAPLNKLKGMLGNTGSNITVIPIANRRELAIMVKEGNEDLSRR